MTLRLPATEQSMVDQMAAAEHRSKAEIIALAVRERAERLRQESVDADLAAALDERLAYRKIADDAIAREAAALDLLAQ